jgi:hypothetical protein
MAKIKLFDRCERPAPGRSSCSAASSAFRWCTSRGWWLAHGGWLGLGLVLLGAVAGPAQDVAPQADNRQLEVQVNLPYAVQFGVSVGSAKPVTLWSFENPRLGVSYRFGDGLTGVSVHFGFLF